MKFFSTSALLACLQSKSESRKTWNKLCQIKDLGNTSCKLIKIYIIKLKIWNFRVLFSAKPH